jgi:hypothetical protein
MTIMAYVGAIAIWCGYVWLILRFFAFCKDDQE